MPADCNGVAHSHAWHEMLMCSDPTLIVGRASFRHARAACVEFLQASPVARPQETSPATHPVMSHVACCIQVVPAAHGNLQTLPNLHVLVVRHLCTVGHLLHVRWVLKTPRKLNYQHQRALESDPGKLRLEAVRPARPGLAQCCGGVLQQLARCGPSQDAPSVSFAVARVPYGSVCLCRCPDLHTMVLFVASLGHVKFLEIFLLQCHDKLSSLQVRTQCDVHLWFLCPGCTVSTAWHPICQASRPSGLIPS